MKKLFLLLMLFVLTVGQVNAQVGYQDPEIPTDEEIELEEVAQMFDEIINSNDEDEGVAVNFPGNPEMPSYQEIEKMREESGYNDFIEGSDVPNKEPDCFDYYKFQSVQVSLGLKKDTFSPGEVIKVDGQVLNENNYPVVDGNVFVRVSRRNGNYQEDGHFIIDEFIAVENVVIDKNATKDISFEWTVPELASPSSYQFDYFFSVGKKFNLGGLPFTNEIIIGQVTFRVVSKQKSFISFDRAKTKVNNVLYEHIGTWPQIAEGDEVIITQSIINTFKEEKNVDITYELFYWDSLNKDDLIDTKSEKITIPADGNIELKYTIQEMNDTVYYLKITAISKESKSIVNIRVVSNQEHPRLNYPAITKFPLKKGDTFTIFSCFHNGSDALTSGRVDIKIFDKEGSQISEVLYNGDIPSSMMLAKKEITALRGYDYVKLKANLYDSNNKLLDRYETVYDCKDLDNCSQKASNLPITKNVKNISGEKQELVNTIVMLSLIFVVFILIYIIYVRYKKR